MIIDANQALKPWREAQRKLSPAFLERRRGPGAEPLVAHRSERNPRLAAPCSKNSFKQDAVSKVLQKARRGPIASLPLKRQTALHQSPFNGKQRRTLRSPFNSHYWES